MSDEMKEDVELFFMTRISSSVEFYIYNSGTGFYSIAMASSCEEYSEIVQRID